MNGKLGTAWLFWMDNRGQCLNICRKVGYSIRIRPKYSESTGSRSLTEVKHCDGRLVVEWVTINEFLLSNVFAFFSS
jgi:hypothetical protein